MLGPCYNDVKISDLDEVRNFQSGSISFLFPLTPATIDTPVLHGSQRSIVSSRHPSAPN